MTTTSRIGRTVRLEGPYDAALDRVVEVLAAHGFGVLTRADLRAAFAEKLGADFRPYTILGACNPRLAHLALSAHPEIGLLLPCNVTVEEEADEGITVRITDPAELFAASGVEPDAEVEGVIAEAKTLLTDVAETLEGTRS